MPIKPKLCEHGVLKKECGLCGAAYQREWRKKHRDTCLARQAKHRKRMLENPMTEKICAVHGKISGKQIDKWSRCIECTRAQNRANYRKNSEKWRSRDIENRKKQNSYSTERRREYRLRHENKLGEKHHKNRRRRQRRQCEILSDGHAKFIMARKYGIERKTIPLEFVAAERELQKLKRKIKGRWKDLKYRRDLYKINKLAKELK